jgi:transcriptional regulator with XRE-family HTH domain
VATLKELRIKQCLSQEDLAKQSGVAAITIMRIELNRQKPRFITRRKLATVLGIKPSEIDFK